MHDQEIMVSVLCATYNQESYIRDAIESFLMQKTNFAFEILMHDDASTDGTADIIREYEQKYPNLIKPIYQTVNQYSQGKDILVEFLFRRANGKYIALCEGDDYWTDPLKLQKQFDAMEAHPEVDMCAHAADTVDEGTKQFIEKVSPVDFETILSVEQIIACKGNMLYLATNSLFYRIEIDKKLALFRQYFPHDYSLRIQGALRGGVYYLSETMSAYRSCARNSFTRRMQEDLEALRLHQKKVISLLHILDIETDGKYHDSIESKILNHELRMNGWQNILKKRYRKIFLEYPLIVRIKIRLSIYFPWLMKIKRKLFGKKG